MSKNPSVQTLLKIGDASKEIGVSIDTLRRWEKSGKLTPTKTPGGTRLYSLEQLRLLSPKRKVIEIPTETPKVIKLDSQSIFSEPKVSPVSFNPPRSVDHSPPSTEHLLKSKAIQGGTGITVPPLLVDSPVQQDPYFKPESESENISNDDNINHSSTSFLPAKGLAIFAILACMLFIIVTVSLLSFTKNPALSGFISKINLSKNPIAMIQTQSSKATPISEPSSDVLAATSIASQGKYLEINADMVIRGDLGVQGKGTFTEDVTAPNLIYGITAGTGIAVSAGQTPTISSTDTLALVTARGATTTTPVTLSGGANIGGTLNLGQLTADPATAVNGATYYNSSSNKFRCYINGSWSDCVATSSGDITAVSAGDGLTGGSSSGDASLSVLIPTTGTSSNTSSNSGLEVGSTGVSLIRGCSDTEILRWNATSSIWACGTATANAIISVKEGGSIVSSTADTLNFLGGDFDLNESPSGQVNIQLASTLTSVTGVSGAFSVPGSFTLGSGSTHLLSGTGAPSNASGSDGDYYFRTDGSTGATSLYYKVSSAWTATGGGSLQNAFDNSTSPEITVDSTRGALTVQDNASPLGANLFEVQSNGGATKYLAVTSSGISTSGNVALSGTTLGGSSLATFTTAASLSATSTTTLTLGTAATLNSNGTTLNLQADGAVDVNIAGGSSSTGCTVTNSTGDLTCTGNITGGSSGTSGFWQRSGTTLSPATSGDSISFTGTINTNTLTSTALTFAGADPVISASTGATSISLNPGAGGTVNLAGGSSSTGCSVDDTTGDLTCTGTIASGGGGSVGYWDRVSTTLSPTNTGDNVTTSGNISATGTGAITSGGTLTAQNGLTLSTGALSLTSSSGTEALTLTSSTTAFNVQSGLFNIDTQNSRVGIGTSSPNNKLEVLSTTSPQVRISYDGSNYATESVSSAGAYTLDTNSTGAINVGTGANAKTVTIGNATGATALAFNSGTGSQTFTSSVASTATTSSAFVFTDNSLTSGTGIYGSSTSLTTGKLFQLSVPANTLTTGTIADIRTTSTGLTGSAGTGSLMNLDWSPASSTTATGDLFAINIGANGITTGNLFNILNNGSSIFAVSQQQAVVAVPTSFTAPGDVSIAYDINFTNPTASYIKSAAPLYIVAGDVPNSSNLNLKTYNQGSIVIDSAQTTGNAVDLTNSTLTTGTGIAQTYSALTTGNGESISSSTLTTGNLLSLASTSTAGNSESGLKIAISGANGTSSVTNYGLQSAITNTGTTSTNVAGLFTATGGTTNIGVQVAAMTGATSTGLSIGALSGTTADTGINIGAISGSGATGTGITVGNISTTGSANLGLALGTLTGGTSTNYQIQTGTLTSIASSTDYHANFGTTVGASSATFGGVNIGAISGAGTQSAGVNIGANTSTATTNYGVNIGAVSGAGTTNYGLYVGSISGSSTNYAAYFAGGNVNIQGLTASSAVYTDASHNLTTTAPTSGGVGFWTRTGTTLTPTTANDVISVPTSNTTGADLGITNTGAYTGTGIFNLTANSATSGTLAAITGNALTSGKLVSLSSTSTALTGSAGTGSLMNLDWSPASSTTATGDLFAINIGSNGVTTGNLFNILNAGSSIFSISQTAFTTSLPANFTSPGDIAAAYDLAFTNPTASTITSTAPLTIAAGETFNSNSLTLTTYNQGSIVVNSGQTTGTMIDLTNATLTTGIGIDGTLSALTTGTGLQVVANALTTGKGISVTSTSTTTTTGSLLNISSATTGAVATNGLVSLNATGNYTSTSNIGLLSVLANSTAAGTIENIQGNALTTGNALRISSSGTGLTTGSLLYLTSATTGAVATNGIVRLNASGNYSSTSNVGLLNVVADSTTAGTIQNLSGAALTTGIGLNLSGGGATALTTGSVLKVTGPTGAAAIDTNGVVNINASGAYTSSSNGGLLNVTASGTTAGKLVNIAASNSSQTSDTALNVVQSGVTTGYTGNFVNITGSSTTGSGNLLNITSVATTGGNAFNITANSLTSGTGQTITGNALTSGTLLSLASTSTALAGTTTTGNGLLANFDWSPGSSTTATGDLWRMHIGANALVSGQLFNIVQDTSSIFSINPQQFTTSLPSNFTAAGDLGLSYDLNFTNPTASYIKSSAPLYLQAGPSYANNDLTLQTFGSGAVVVDNNGDTGATYGTFYVHNSSTSVTGTTTTNANVAGSFVQTEDADTITSLIRNNNASITMADVGTAGAQGDPGILTIESASGSSSAYNLITAYNSTTRSDAAAVFRVRADGNVYGEAAFNSSGADYAEYFPTTDKTISKGDVVMLDPANPKQVLKSNIPNSANLLGVISTRPSVIGSADGGGHENDPFYKVVGMIGQIPTKVSIENGPITRGDYLTSSSTPGVAMKSNRPGPVIGKALEDYPSPTNNTGSVLALIQPGMADPGNVLANLSLDSNGNLVIPKLKANIDLNSVTLTSPITLNSSASQVQIYTVTNAFDALAEAQNQTQTQIASLNGAVLGLQTTQNTQTNQITDLQDRLSKLEATLATQSAALTPSSNPISQPIANLTNNPSTPSASLTPEATNSATPSGQIADQSINQLNLTPPDILLATGSANLANIRVTDTITSDKLLTALDATFSGTFKALGDTFLGQTTISGDLNIDGTLSVSQDSINVVGAPNTQTGILYLQNNALAQGIDIFNGKVTIDKTGKLTAQTISADKVQASEFQVTSGTTTGSGQINSGTHEVAIFNDKVTNTSRIFITPTSQTSQPISVTAKINGKGFVVGTTNPVSQDVTFDYWIINEVSQ